MSAPYCPSHAPLQYFHTDNDCLLVHGIRIDRLARRVGQTPFYAYDRSVIDRRLVELRNVLPEQVHVHYAIKANPMPAVVQHLSNRVEGLDVASGGELGVALDTGIDPASVSFAGPGKTVREIDQAVAAGCVINVESARELDIAAARGRELQVRPKIALRVNPDFELKSSGMRMSGGAKQFGIDAESIPEVANHAAVLGLDIVGLHIFSGSQNLRSESIIEAQIKAVELAESLAPAFGAPLRILNVGGGFGIPYFPGEAALDIRPIGRNLGALDTRIRTSLPGAHLVVELGRYLVGEAGIYVAQVIDRKVSRGEVFLVTDGGLHHHLAASGNFGQVIRKNYPVIIATRVRGSAREHANVVGPLCTPLDVLGAKMDLAVAEPGDLIAVFQSGAYGYSASPHAFLGHPSPTEILV